VYVLAHGRSFVPTPRPRDVRKRLNRRCYANAVNFVQLDDEAYDYCEGWAVPLSGPPVQHAWVSKSGTDAMEFTWRIPGLAYFDVLLPDRLLSSALLGTGVFGPLLGWVATERI
jgi:hypothetical protein